ncbi:Putative mitochondrial carnitine O-acetyltransferase [Seminavis robusta]|uniref:Mitochondrial carnitine O-acetyltransferase n=1 Tax=Seminavis robusta TaxID=568900 RepID=A0A9N8DWU3_9STRA|nr:Putative mitochondrial carnitine O-acetyltransferase [Seminavis robusta]|eukprot:Sro412_g137790.1 Putative mitochondrial carnitine O-acetyltransferase (840) ;mRNA; f:11687-14382
MATTQINGPTDGSKAINGKDNLRGGSKHGYEDRRPSFLRVPSDTYGAQSTLPRLPIPTLDETLDKFPKMIQAVQTKEEHAETLKMVEDFRKTDGPKLQQMLIDYDQEGARTGAFGSYVEEFWNDSYLAPDSSVVLNLNPFFILEKGPDRKIANNQLQRAASLCFASLKMASMLKRETLPPDTFKGRPLCMDQFKVLFGTTRIPGGPGVKDYVDHYPDSTHVVVLIRNHIYYFQALWPSDFSVAVDQHDIKDILEAIQKHADLVRASENEADGAGSTGNFVVDGKDGTKIPINSCDEALGVLTSLPRNEWAAARKMILDGDNKQNAQALRVIDSALFVLVLDDRAPQDINDAASNMLHGSHKLVMDRATNKFVQVGTCCNRWYDKLQLIVMANGKAGVNFEHSAIDGHTALRYVSDIFAENVVQFAQSITALIYGKGWIPDNMNAPINRASTSMTEASKHAPPGEADEKEKTLDVFPKKLEFHLPPKVKELIRHAETNLGDQIIASDMEILEFQGYGKSLIVKNSLSPDSFVQMSMMMAYYSLYGKFVCSYEPVLTKAFYHGRTEAMRGATPQAKKLCEVWCNPKSTKVEKLEALRVATKEHSRLVRECANGKGVDRHLFALKCIAERNSVPLPALFKSGAWKTLNHTVLSTSNCGNPSLRLFGFGPVVQDGFGIGYIIKDHGVQFAISSKHRQTKRFVNELENTLIALKRLLNAISSVVCGGHHNHVIHQAHVEIKAEQESDDMYGDFWGESVLDSTKASAEGSRKNDTKANSPKKNEDEPDSKLFSMVVRKDSLCLTDIKQIGLHLSFDESVESGSSGASDERNNMRRDSSHSDSDST